MDDNKRKNIVTKIIIYGIMTILLMLPTMLGGFSVIQLK